MTMGTNKTAELQQLAEYAAAALGKVITKSEIAFGELTLNTEPGDLLAVLRFLRDDPKTRFRVLIDIAAVDYPERARRFDVVYNMLSLPLNLRVRVRVQTDEDTPVPSAMPVYVAADWFEREAWDLFGVLFSGHPDLRRLLTDYGFEGHPMRKDFPLTGHVEVRYDDELKRVVYEPVRLTQEFRRFDFVSPWEGAARVLLPGDEKATQSADKPAPKAP